MCRSLFIALPIALFVGFNGFALASNPPTKPVQPALKRVALVAPHCQVPCGIYTDQLRFESMLEDTRTIAKGIGKIKEFAANSGNGLTGNAINQNIRWVTTKEAHATHIQEVMASYFFAQRIKSDHKDYTGQLASAHRVIVAAMKVKQAADPATADALKAAILDFYRAYEGKEPDFHEE